MQRKIAIICSSRATYGYKRRIIKSIHEAVDLEAQVIITGMHLLPEYGLTVREIEKDGVPIAARVDMMVGGDTPGAWAKSIGIEIQSLAQAFSMLQPEIVLVTGDRGEMFGAAACAAYMNIPVAHIQAGDNSGHIDGSARHAITKLCHIHFPSCVESAERVIRMGEEPWRVHNVGAPQLDEIVQGEKVRKDELQDFLGVKLDRQTILVIQHPVLVENTQSNQRMIETMEAVKHFGIQTIVIYPNMDAGGQGIIDAINQYTSLEFVHSFHNLERKFFISLLGEISVLVGNSSCGILEAPSFKLAAVNIGNRQRNRMQANNVINVDHGRKEIIGGIEKALYDENFKQALTSCVNPYGDGHSSERIVEILRSVELDKRLLDKMMTF